MTLKYGQNSKTYLPHVPPRIRDDLHKSTAAQNPNHADCFYLLLIELDKSHLAVSRVAIISEWNR